MPQEASGASSLGGEMDFYDTDDAMGLAQRVKSGEVTADELLQEAAKRIERTSQAP